MYGTRTSPRIFNPIYIIRLFVSSPSRVGCPSRVCHGRDAARRFCAEILILGGDLGRDWVWICAAWAGFPRGVGLFPLPAAEVEVGDGKVGIGKLKPSSLPGGFQAVGIHWSVEHYVTFTSAHPQK